jgi:hypothetical protein
MMHITTQHDTGGIVQRWGKSIVLADHIVISFLILILVSAVVAPPIGEESIRLRWRGVVERVRDTRASHVDWPGALKIRQVPRLALLARRDFASLQAKK